jgi:hypothetical protein
MDDKKKKMILKKVRKFENEFRKAELNVSSITDFIQPFFEQEVTVLMSNDGMAITDDNGEIGFVEDFINSL